jgi:hypothetical protein
MRKLMLAAWFLIAPASPTLADTAHCTTRYNEAFKCWVTSYTDSSRTIARYDEQLQRYHTDITKPPQGWPRSSR